MQYTVVREDELYHHGILGQKWGVRRYQNEDGTLTDAGRKRYGEDLDIKDKSRTNVARIRLGEARRRYDEAKANDSSGQRALKKRVKMAKRQLKEAKTIDKGQELYKEGRTITGTRLRSYIRAAGGIMAGEAWSKLVNQGINNLSAQGKLAPHHIASARILDRVGQVAISAAGLALAQRDEMNIHAMRSYLHRDKNITTIGSEEYADVKKRRQGK